MQHPILSRDAIDEDFSSHMVGMKWGVVCVRTPKIQRGSATENKFYSDSVPGNMR